jgi:7-cyano-7-deazaguanine synthase
VPVPAAAAWAESAGAARIYIGATADDYAGFPDCRPEFFAAWNQIPGLPEVAAPLTGLRKGDVIRRAAELGVDLSQTLSCYTPSDQARPCRSCAACHLRAEGFADAGIPDPA